MTGSPCSTGSTSGRHPNLLQQQGCRDNGVSDKLRRMAIKNSYESRSLCGSGAGDIQAVPALVEKASQAPTGKLLPTVTKQLSSHRYSLSSRSKRPAQKQLSAPPRSASAAVRTKVSPSTVHDVGASAGDDPKVDEAKTETQTASLQAPPDVDPLSAIPAHLRRSTSHSSVAVNGTSSLSQPSGDSSSYIYHIPNRLIQRGRSRSQSRVHAHMHTHNIPTLSLKRSSSHSTVALNRTSHHLHPGQHQYPCSPCPSSLVPPSHVRGTPTPAATSPATPLSASMGVVHHPEPPHHHNHHHLHRHHHCYGNGWMGSLSQDHFDGVAAVPAPSTISSGHNKVRKGDNPFFLMLGRAVLQFICFVFDAVIILNSKNFLSCVAAKKLILGFLRSKFA